jgi:hypothetical protein
MTHMEVRALRQRVLPGMTDEVVSWLRAVAASPADALAGLAEEGIVSESFFLSSTSRERITWPRPIAVLKPRADSSTLKLGAFGIRMLRMRTRWS